MPIFRVKSVKIYTSQKKFTRIYSWRSWQISGMQLYSTNQYKATQLRSLSGCLPSLEPSSNLVEADHMQVQRAREDGACCNRPRSIQQLQHGASCMVPQHSCNGLGHTHILSTNDSYWLCCCKIEKIHNSKQNIKTDPNMSSAQWALLIAHEMAQRRTKWRESTSWTSLTCHVVDMLDLVDRVADSLGVVDIADIMDKMDMGG